jgi:predicted acylesterase/phospholipase RssA
MTTDYVGPFNGADLNCDVILKGGVTSGVVYPLALCELAKKYQFRRLGGTSSGAIVAAFAAAAEFYRQTHGVTNHRAPAKRSACGELRPGFVGLQDFADDVQTGDKLFSVFKPDEATKPIFDVLFAGHLEDARERKENEKRAASKDTKVASDPSEVPQPIVRTLIALWSHLPKALPITGSVLALAALFVVTWPMIGRITALVHEGWRHALLGDALALLLLILLIAAAAVGGLIGAVVSAVTLVKHKWIPTFVANGFGLTRGLVSPAANGAGPARDMDGPEPYSLTTWMTRIINELAGRKATDRPLTIGDLRRAGGATAEPAIQFETTTTCLTLGRPLRLPNDLDKDLPFYFDPDEWRAYFPSRVLQILKENSPERPRHREPGKESGPLYYRLPKSDGLPVVVATRMSVALPGVLSAIPLWSVDLNTRGALGAAEIVLERAWFSDGGIGSNFPIHFFDALLPRWPTFGFDLRDASQAYPLDALDQKKNVWMPLTNDQGRTEWWTRLASDRQPGSPLSPELATRAVGQFALTVLSTIMTWRDNMLARETGFRDRIMHIKLDPDREGGLNLDMPREVIGRLVKRGEAAGALLRHRYTITEDELKAENDSHECALIKTHGSVGYWRPVTVSWENHRWIRFRASMAALQESLELMNTAYTSTGYGPLVSRPAGISPLDFQWSSQQRAADPFVKTAMLLAALQGWRNAPAIRFDAGELPDRRPELRMSPRV